MLEFHFEGRHQGGYVLCFWIRKVGVVPFYSKRTDPLLFGFFVPIIHFTTIKIYFLLFTKVFIISQIIAIKRLPK